MAVLRTAFQPCRCSSTAQPPALRRAPEHGEDTEALLLELGYGWEDISELKGAGVVL